MADGDDAICGLKIKAGREQPEDDHEKRYQGKSVHIRRPFNGVMYLIGFLWTNVNPENELQDSSTIAGP